LIEIARLSSTRLGKRSYFGRISRQFGGGNWHMHIAVNTIDRKWGNYPIEQYSMWVSRDDKEVTIYFSNRQDSIQTGGHISLPVNVANRLGHLLVMLSSGQSDAFTDQGIRIKVDEATQTIG
jgi:hypothetical protein